MHEVRAFCSGIPSSRALGFKLSTSGMGVLHPLPRSILYCPSPSRVKSGYSGSHRRQWQRAWLGRALAGLHEKALVQHVLFPLDAKRRRQVQGHGERSLRLRTKKKKKINRSMFFLVPRNSNNITLHYITYMERHPLPV